MRWEVRVLVLTATAFIVLGAAVFAFYPWLETEQYCQPQGNSVVACHYTYAPLIGTWTRTRFTLAPRLQ